MYTVNEAVRDLLMNPWTEETTANALPVIRENAADAKPLLKAVMADRFDTPFTYMIPDLGAISQNTDGDYNHLSQLAAAQLLAEMEDPEVFDLLRDLYHDSGDLSQNPILQDFTLNELQPIVNRFSAGHEDELIEDALNESLDPEVRGAAMKGIVKSFKNGRISEEKVVETLMPLLDPKASDEENVFTWAVYAAGGSGLDAFKEKLSEVWPEYEKQHYPSLEDVLDGFGADLKAGDNPIRFEDAKSFGELSASYYGPKGLDLEQAQMEAASNIDPHKMMALLKELQGMSPEEMDEWGMAHPVELAQMNRMAEQLTQGRNPLTGAGNRATKKNTKSSKSKKKSAKAARKKNRKK